MNDYIPGYLPCRVRIVITCCGGRAVAKLSLPVHEGAEPSFSDRELIRVSSPTHDGVRYVDTGRAAVLPESHDHVRVHVSCPRCALDMQLSNDVMLRLLVPMRDSYLAGESPSDLRLTAKQFGALTSP